MARTIVANYDSASIALGAGTYISGDDVYATPRRTYDNYWWWASFAITEAGGWRPRIRIPISRMFTSITSARVASWRYFWWTRTPDVPESWVPFDSQVLNGSYLDIQHATPFTGGAGETVYVALYPQYSYGRVQAKLAAWAAHPNVHGTPSAPAPSFTYATIPARANGDGRTAPALPCLAMRITDLSVAAPKRTAVFLAGVHAGETPGQFTYEGGIDFLLSSDPVALRMQQEWDVWCYLFLTPQGKWGGWFRGDPEDTGDHNRSWGTTSVEAIQLAKAAMQTDLAGRSVQVIGDYHSMFGTDPRMMGDFYGSWTQFFDRMRALDPSITLYGDGTTPTSDGLRARTWMHQQFGSDETRLVYLSESGMGLAHDVDSWRLFGERQMRVLDAMAQAGEITAQASEWVAVDADLAADAGSYTDTTAEAGYSYEYRVVARRGSAARASNVAGPVEL